MGSVSIPTAISAVSGIAGAGASLLAGNQAADASQQASADQLQVAQENIARSQPFVDVGTSAANQLKAANDGGFGLAGQPNYLDAATAAIPNANNMGDLTATPGYQFNLTQGLQATQNAAAARGLGVSGAALKGAATYATGLADSTYQNQFANQQTKMQDLLNLNTGQQGNVTNQYNRLAGTATIGANAASSVGTSTTSAANAAGNYLTQGGQAAAAGTVGAANAASNSANNFLSNQYLQALTGGSTGSVNDNLDQGGEPKQLTG